MKFSTIKRRVRRYLKDGILVINGLFAMAFPFTEQIIAGVQANMPKLAEYLPPNIYQTVGIAVVVLNVLIGASKVRRAAKAEDAGASA